MVVSRTSRDGERITSVNAFDLKNQPSQVLGVFIFGFHRMLSRNIV